MQSRSETRTIDICGESETVTSKWRTAGPCDGCGQELVCSMHSIKQNYKFGVWLPTTSANDPSELQLPCTKDSVIVYLCTNCTHRTYQTWLSPNGFSIYVPPDGPVSPTGRLLSRSICGPCIWCGATKLTGNSFFWMEQTGIAKMLSPWIDQQETPQ
jgi:hypothetical protein